IQPNPHVFLNAGCMTSQGHPERETILLKGATLKKFFPVNQDDSDWSKLGVKEGQKKDDDGSADEIVKVPEKGHVFMEDLSEEEQVAVVCLRRYFEGRDSTKALNGLKYFLTAVVVVA
nr:ubiquitin carboxyl-terminal hydrolase 6 [Tanacetum cinerariifolium]